MFERYTEKAKRIIFLGAYEARQFGSPSIETEHLLLGLLGEDKALANRFLESATSVESIRKQIQSSITIKEKLATSVDVPLSNENKRVLAYAAEEAERLSHEHIGTEHLLLGFLREEKCFAAEILRARGLKLPAIREQLGPANEERANPPRKWAGIARRHYWTGAAVQLVLLTLLVLVVAKSAVSGRHLLVIATIWFAVVFAWLRTARFSFFWSYGKTNRFFAVAITYAFSFLYYVLVIGWIIPLGVGLYRAAKR